MKTFVWFLWLSFLATLMGLWIGFVGPEASWLANLLIGCGYGMGGILGSFHVSEIADRV